MPEPASSEPQIVVPDCNVLIHGKALHNLPWEEWGQEAIEILIVGPVLGELDTVKTRPGRPGRIAREINSEIRALLYTPSHEDVLREASPRVTRRLWLGQKEAREPLREGIECRHGDQTIITRAQSGGRKIRKPELFLPELRVDDLSAPMQPLGREQFNILWHASGWVDGSPSFS